MLARLLAALPVVFTLALPTTATVLRGQHQVPEGEPSRGDRATLDEDGYMWVAKTENTKEMTTYARRLASSLGLDIINEGGFLGMVPFYSGERSMQSHHAMKQELIRVAADSNGWVKERKPSGSMLYSVKDMNGANAPLNERGYKSIVKLKNHEMMARFIRRTVQSMGYFVTNEGSLHGVVPYYSGELGEQSFSRLRLEIVNNVKSPAGWATNGASAVLDQAGYRQVAHIRNGKEMLTFTKRLGHHLGCQIRDDGAFAEGFGKHVSLFLSRDFAWLTQAVKKACDIQENAAYYGAMHDVVGKHGVLQVRLKNSTRYKYSEKQLRAAGIVPTQFDAVNAKETSQEELKKACPLSSDAEAKQICQDQENKLGIQSAGLSQGTPGCTSKVEQAITDSHRQALLAAQERDESEWTAIIEDDVVPLHPGFFDSAFKKTWAKVPKWAKLVRLSWCTFEADLGSIRKKTYANTAPFRLVHEMSWFDSSAGIHRYYTGGCTTGYMVHKSFLPELLSVFPCCCPIDCCMERQLFYAPTKPFPIEGKFRGEQIMINMDAWDSKEDSFNYTSFYQGGVFVQDNRATVSSRPGWNNTDS